MKELKKKLIFVWLCILLLSGNWQAGVAQKPPGTWYEANGYSTTIIEKQTVTKQQLMHWLSEPFGIVEAFDVFANDSCGLEIFTGMEGRGLHTWGYRNGELHEFSECFLPKYSASHYSTRISYDEKRQILYFWNYRALEPDTYIVYGTVNGELKCMGRDLEQRSSPSFRVGYYTFRHAGHDRRDRFNHLYNEWIKLGKEFNKRRR